MSRLLEAIGATCCISVQAPPFLDPTCPLGFRNYSFKGCTHDAQAQHAARELFMTHGVDAHLAGEAILRQCTVLDPHSFAESSAAGDDVFLCQYVYNERDKAWLVHDPGFSLLCLALAHNVSASSFMTSMHCDVNSTLKAKSHSAYAGCGPT